MLVCWWVVCHHIFQDAYHMIFKLKLLEISIWQIYHLLIIFSQNVEPSDYCIDDIVNTSAHLCCILFHGVVTEVLIICTNILCCHVPTYLLLYRKYCWHTLWRKINFLLQLVMITSNKRYWNVCDSFYDPLILDYLYSNSINEIMRFVNQNIFSLF